MPRMKLALLACMAAPTLSIHSLSSVRGSSMIVMSGGKRLDVTVGGLRGWEFCPLAVGSLRLRGGDAEETKEGVADRDKEGDSTNMIDRLKNNQSLSPADHQSGFEWLLAVLLTVYAAIGAPFASYIPILKDLAFRKPKPVVLSEAEKGRMEREALRKEQEEEFEQTMMEDRMKEEEKRKKKEAAEAEARAKAEAAKKESSAVSDYTKTIEGKKAAAGKEPDAGEGFVVLRVRCPDGTQLTRNFSVSGPVSDLYDYVDIARFDKAQNTAKPEVVIKELASFQYVLVSTMPRLLLTDRTLTLADAGIKASCALVVQPIVKD